MIAVGGAYMVHSPGDGAQGESSGSPIDGQAIVLISFPSYFNTVGSKEGWTPSQFKSSRESRREVDPSRTLNLPQAFMDEEDLADVAESQKLGTSQSFTGISGRQDDSLPSDKFLSLLHMKTETTGVML